jgi:ketosteroid isomerase-like protein
MDRAGFAEWLDRYVEAWRTYDPERIGSLFADDAEYRYHPWDEGSDVAVGRAAIVAAWLEDRDEETGSWSAEYEPFAVDGERAVAVGVSRYFRPDGSIDREYHNVFLCRFDGDGRCREFTELFMRRDPSASP